MGIAILSNVNMDLIVDELQEEYSVYSGVGFNNWRQDFLDNKSFLYSDDYETIFLIIDGESIVDLQKSFKENLDRIDSTFGIIKKYSNHNFNKNIIVSNIDIIPRKLTTLSDVAIERKLERYWEEKLEKIVEDFNNIYVFDLKKIVEKIGRENFYTQKLWYMGSIRFSNEGNKEIISHIRECIRAINNKSKKCLLLDLDNTLWGGVIGEDGIKNIRLANHGMGARYKDFQKVIKEMKELGVMLAIVSKNNLSDAIDAIENHEDMVLRKDDFVGMKINWEHKSQNILNLRDELNIGLNSMVFIDDSNMEREFVKQQLPEVEVIDFPKNPSDLPKMIKEIYYKYFFKKKLIYEDKNKTLMYKQNKLREDEKIKYEDMDDFLKSLNIKVYLNEASIEDIERVHQLIHKTNQFNLTCERLGKGKVMDYLRLDSKTIFIVQVKDKFGDNGKVGLVLLSMKDNKEIIIDNFLLSCRVMGRYIEDTIIDYIEKTFRAKGYQTIKAQYKQGPRNKPVANLYDRLGYQVIIDGDSNRIYELNLQKNVLKQRKKLSELFILN